MKISRLMVRGYQQFEDLDLDLTDASGKPLERVCFLGSNGTGKTTLLRVLRSLLGGTGNAPGGISLLCLTDSSGLAAVAAGPAVATGFSPTGRAWFGPLATNQLDDLVGGLGQPATHAGLGGRLMPPGIRGLPRRAAPAAPNDVIASVSADANVLLQHDPPRATLNEALPLRRSRPLEHEIGPHTADALWRLLIAHAAKREEDFRGFLALEDNRKRTVEAVEADFSTEHPEIFPALADLWNRLLEPAGLELDIAGKKLPSQLTESLTLHVRVKRTGHVLGYNALSSGMRSFLFRLGYLKTLFFEPPTGSSFVLVDEPEASLHPDFLYDIVDVYQSVCVGSQLFFATHSPIVAAQFKPEERVILEFDENRFVKARRGVAPEGDDPNDLLSQDFHVRSILGKEGVKKWKRFLELDELMRRETDAAQREKYRREYMEIGAAYHFEPRTDA